MPAAQVIALVAFLLSWLAPVPVQAWNDLVLAVHGCERIEVRHRDRVEVVRLYGITCTPPSGPADPALDLLSARLSRRVAKIHPVGRDRQGRIEAMVWVQGHLLNETLVRQGLARVDPRRCRLPICGEWLCNGEGRR